MSARKIVTPEVDNFTQNQKRAVAIATALALLFGAYFLSSYFVLIVVAAILAFLFLPLYKKLYPRLGSGGSATVTFFTALLLLLVPLIGIVALAVVEITGLVDNVSEWVSATDMSALGQEVINIVNNILASIPFIDFQLTATGLQDAITNLAYAVGNWFVSAATSFVSSLFSSITTSIIFIYVFISLLVNHEKLKRLFMRLNPLGPEVSEMYLHKAGAMVHGAVGGQFIIAIAQGFTGALSLYIVGFQEAFFFFAILFTLLSLIPLGSGIITIPFGIGMMLFGNFWGGLFVVLWHILGVTNIDNILRPILVPRVARLDPALMILTVFAGIAMFDFWGIFIGPVIMILIVSTIQVYLAVYKDVPMKVPEAKTKKPHFARVKKLFTRK